MGLVKQGVALTVYAENMEKTKKIKDCGEVRPVWNKGLGAYAQMTKHLVKDKPDIIHIQQELNMYGGMVVSVLFPAFLLFLKLFKAKKVVTVHAVVEKKLINREFVKFFKGDDSKIPPIALKMFFQYLYWFIVLFSDSVIVHTELLKKHLTQYHVKAEKINVIPIAAWIKFNKIQKQRGDYFFYFGYLVRRKGLKNVVEGFIKFAQNKKNKDFKLLLGGGVIKGQEFARDEILGLIEKSKLEDRIRYLGFLSKGDMDKYIANCYACVVPGVFTVAGSGPLSHIFGYGKCVLVSNVGYLAEEVKNGVEGFLANNDNWSEAFSKAANNPEVIADMEKNVEKKALSRSNEEVARMHLRAYGL